MIAVARRPERVYVDFAHVPVSQWKIHDRLENWARWCHGNSGEKARTDASPMFSLYRSGDAKRAERLYGAPTELPVDKMDAQAVAKGVALLPEKHRRALHWNYIRPRNPTSQARELGVNLAGLAQLVSDARQMLVNRRI